MKRSYFLLLLAFLTLVIKAPCASNDDAQNQLKQWVNQVTGITSRSKDRESLRNNVRPVLEHIINFESMTRRAIGPGWRQFTPAQQKEAIRLFTTLIIRTYTAKFTPGEIPSVSFKGVTSPTPGRVEVSTTALYKGSSYDAIYRMEQSNGWLITDIVVEGVSIVANYRSQFESEFQQGGAAEVLNSLNLSVNTKQ
jgi:phospholipid transport system substrate-binding protein